MEKVCERCSRTCPGVPLCLCACHQIRGDFDSWWNDVGRFLDPDTSDVPWHDKLEGLCHWAWNAAQGRHYAVDGEEPAQVTQLRELLGSLVRCYEEDTGTGLDDYDQDTTQHAVLRFLTTGEYHAPSATVGDLEESVSE